MTIRYIAYCKSISLLESSYFVECYKPFLKKKMGLYLMNRHKFADDIFAVTDPTDVTNSSSDQSIGAENLAAMVPIRPYLPFFTAPVHTPPPPTSAILFRHQAPAALTLNLIPPEIKDGESLINYLNKKSY